MNLGRYTGSDVELTSHIDVKSTRLGLAPRPRTPAHPPSGVDLTQPIGRYADLTGQAAGPAGRCCRMARRRIALLLLVGLGGCGADPDPPAEARAAARGPRAREPGRAEGRSWRAAAAAEARRLARLRAAIRRARARERSPVPCAGAPHREHLARRPRAPHARLRRRAARARPSDRHARRRAAHGPDDGQRPRLAAPALARPAAADVPDPAPQHGVLDARAVPGRLPADDVRPRPGGVPVLPRPRAAAPAPRELGQGQLAARASA